MKTFRSDGRAGRVLGIAPSYDQMMRGVGAVAMPSGMTFGSFSEIQKQCNEYAKQRALDRLKSSGDVSALTEVQSDVDTCMNSLDRGRQIRQALFLAAGLGLAGYLGFTLYRQR
jgi:hypothetical protein